MVELCRVDDRMLHGQVAPDAILIANDEAATNEMSKLAFKMAKPAGVKLAIKTVKDAAVLLNDPRTKKTRIFLIVRTVQDALELVKATGGQIKSVNIGGVKKKEGSRQVAANVHMNDDDLTTLRELNSLVYVELRMVPSESKTDVSKLI
ncbi:PTS sugar transporter subunit IIB [Holdemania sp. Marseille-P2844]|uniref:PTS system mannose/fructose/N-acetylgalactosamine-transporter subunit IIB n=1 Tax=Holdemania sp. Marseille-P2844 TaxID=1852366 RepID=UPI000934005F|nr:PTS sugar transporter subunit IIB [Holdemania sp. Marseille-P2844]